MKNTHYEAKHFWLDVLQVHLQKQTFLADREENQLRQQLYHMLYTTVTGACKHLIMAIKER